MRLTPLSVTGFKTLTVEVTMSKTAFDFNAKTLDFVERLNRVGLPRYLIAHRLGISPTTLTKYMRLANLTPAYQKPGGRQPVALPMREVIELYVCEFWSTHRLARFYKCSHSTVGNYLKNAGVVLRTGSACHV